MSVGLLMIGDGRTETHERSLASLKRHLTGHNDLFDQVVTVDDSSHSLGFAGAVQHGWDQLTTDYVFHVELDFLFNWPVDLKPILKTLDERKYLTQIALLRGPENAAEHEVGGIIQQHPEDYRQLEAADGRAWIEHRRFFTTNPCVYPAWVRERGWPQVSESEGRFSHALFGADPARRSAFWGHGEQWVEHIGRREGTGY